jgi:hypothetical protein|tara:strand:+ start:326 stop:586 length:261 start_codon:yes stop_codon:yes gene_type:complete
MTSEQAIADIEVMRGPGTYYQDIITRLEEKVREANIHIGRLNNMILALEQNGAMVEETLPLKEKLDTQFLRKHYALDRIDRYMKRS